MGSFIHHVDRNLDFFDPPPPLWTILLSKAYVVIRIFGKPPPPAMSAWLMNAPLCTLRLRSYSVIKTDKTLFLCIFFRIFYHSILYTNKPGMLKFVHNLILDPICSIPLSQVQVYHSLKVRKLMIVAIFLTRNKHKIWIYKEATTWFSIGTSNHLLNSILIKILYQTKISAKIISRWTTFRLGNWLGIELKIR